MRINTRFTLHLALGIILWLLLSGICMVIGLEGILPLFKKHASEAYQSLLVAWIFGFSTIICIAVFGWYFGGPLGFIMSWIHQLSQENYTQPVGLSKIYTRKGKLRMRYMLYQEVLQHLQSLSGKLKAAETERGKVEQAKQEWIAGISHDLKTPLTYITGYSTLLLNDQYDWSKEEARSFIQEISDKSKHMEELIQDLSLVIQFNNTDGQLPLHKTSQDIVDFTKRIVANISNNPQANDYILHFKTATSVINIDFDTKFMQRILQNILMNAVIHNPPNTNIYTQIFDRLEHVEIHIVDNGVGMSQHMMENIFQHYYRGTTTESSSEGTGLGMAIVYKLVQAHNGTILVQSEPSNGTTFIITLPKK
ncbi:sensor histidine kinase [Lysinibacillus xylanilyticus]|uniref:histidine kinase n=1 Tax=Lysinibacillus xylanilyticus TaxID=582475 RepID=A0A2M9PYF5_9BACI|nr:HAMP domain-containing sensor histidine kinase [Lysinibacillus xylanilyticus]PJO40742.1 sensor histidine kinase [Lysinibacillus xylanilyticus]